MLDTRWLAGAGGNRWFDAVGLVTGVNPTDLRGFAAEEEPEASTEVMPPIPLPPETSSRSSTGGRLTPEAHSLSCVRSDGRPDVLRRAAIAARVSP